MSSGHVLIMLKLSCIINDDHIFLSFGKDLPGHSSCDLYMAFQLLKNQASRHIKAKKGTGHVFYMAIPSHTNESVGKTHILRSDLWWTQKSTMSTLAVKLSVSAIIYLVDCHTIYGGPLDKFIFLIIWPYGNFSIFLSG